MPEELLASIFIYSLTKRRLRGQILILQVTSESVKMKTCFFACRILFVLTEHFLLSRSTKYFRYEDHAFPSMIGVYEGIPCDINPITNLNYLSSNISTNVPVFPAAPSFLTSILFYSKTGHLHNYLDFQAYLHYYLFYIFFINHIFTENIPLYIIIIFS